MLLIELLDISIHNIGMTLALLLKKIIKQTVVSFLYVEENEQLKDIKKEGKQLKSSETAQKISQHFLVADEGRLHGICLFNNGLHISSAIH